MRPEGLSFSGEGGVYDDRDVALDTCRISFGDPAGDSDRKAAAEVMNSLLGVAPTMEFGLPGTRGFPDESRGRMVDAPGCWDRCVEAGSGRGFALNPGSGVLGELAGVLQVKLSLNLFAVVLDSLDA